MTARARQSPELVAIAGLAPVCALCALLVHVAALRVLATIPLCLLFPGFCLQAAIFHDRTVEIPTRLSLTIGLSLVTLVLGGIVLNQLPGGLQRSSWTVLLLVLIEGEVAVALTRRHGRASLAGRRAVSQFSPRTLVNAGLLSIALVIGAGAFAASRLPLDAPHTNGYETLNVAINRHDHRIEFQITSARRFTTTYRFSLSIRGRRLMKRAIRLAPGTSTVVSLDYRRFRGRSTVDASVVLAKGHWTPRHVTVQLPTAGA